MEDMILFGLRGAGIALATLLGALILLKSRQWQDPALIWLFAGLSVGPVVVLSWNILYRLWLTGYLPPTMRVPLGPEPGIQFRYLYDVANKVLDSACVAAVAIGIAKLYTRAHERVTLVPPEKATTNDPRN